MSNINNLENAVSSLSGNLTVIDENITTVSNDLIKLISPFEKMNNFAVDISKNIFGLKGLDPLGPMFDGVNKTLSDVSKSNPLETVIKGLDDGVKYAQDLNSAFGDLKDLQMPDFENIQIDDIKNAIEPFEKINGVLVDIGDKVFGLEGFDPLGPMFEGINEGIGFVENFNSILGEMTKLTDLQKLATDSQALATSILNSSLVTNTIELGKNALAWLSAKAEIVLSTIATWAQNAATLAQNVATQIGTAIQGAFNVVMAMNPIALIIIAVVALVAAFVLLWNNCEGFRNFFIGLWDTLKGAGSWIAEVFGGIFTSLGKIISGVFSGLKDVFIDVINFITRGLNAYIKIMLIPVNLIITGLNFIPGVNIPALKLEIPQIPKLATGGMPEFGQMFIARENGPELVGRFGNQNVVANNNQIIEGIKQGVIEANYVSQNNNSGGNWIIQLVDIYGKIKSTSVISAAERKNTRDGKTIIPVGI